MMAQTVGVTQAMTSLNVAHRKLGLQPSDDPGFFGEWLEALPELTEMERAMLDRLKQRYFYYAADGAITEGTIDVVLVSPLLELLELCDPPYKIRGEKLVKIEIESEAEILEGFIDALVVQEQFWLILIEEKRYGFSVMQALPQTLAYMMAQPLTDAPGFGLITTGEDYLFVKVDRRSQELLELCDPPYKIRGEKLVKIEIESEAEILEGFIDALVVQEQFWLILIEEKRYGFSVMQALPQTLAYMMAQPLTDAPGFGLITTGEDYLFVKVDRRSQAYSWSNKFTLSNPQRNELYDVVRVMKRLIGSMGTIRAE